MACKSNKLSYEYPNPNPNPSSQGEAQAFQSGLAYTGTFLGYFRGVLIQYLGDNYRCVLDIYIHINRHLYVYIQFIYIDRLIPMHT